MNIRQLHDELRKPGRIEFGCDGPPPFVKAADGWIKQGFGKDTRIVCHVDDLERDDWSVTRTKAKS